MNKHHDHWNISECSACKDRVVRPTEIEIDLHQQFVSFQTDVRELLKSLEAQRQINEGFRGMGYNILQETASSYTRHLRRIRRVVGDD